MRIRSCLALVLVCLLGVVRPSQAGEPPTTWAMLGGGATALVPMAIGSYLFADNLDDDHRKAGALTLVTGLALAPIVSHLAVREWARAGIFGAIPVACALGMTLLVELQPSVTAFGTPQTRLTFGMLISFATLSAGVGLIDTLGAGRRAHEQEASRRARAGRTHPVQHALGFLGVHRFAVIGCGPAHRLVSSVKRDHRFEARPIGLAPLAQQG